MKSAPVPRHPAPAALLASLATALLLSGCAPSRQAPPQAPKAVSVARAVRSSISVSLSYPARIRPRQEIVVSAKVAGRVAAVSAEVGQHVTQGDVLFTLESGDFEAQARQADAALQSARANLTRTSDSSLSSQLIQARAAADQAAIQYKDAKDLFDRTSSLYTSGTATKQQLDGAKAKLDSAGVARDAAEQNLSLLSDKAGPQSTGVASTQVDQAQATADLAASQLSNTRVTSPITGVVSARNVDPGELVSSAVPAFVVIDVSSVTAEMVVEEDRVGSLRVAQTLSVSVEAAGRPSLAGLVESISPASDARTQGYVVKVRVAQPGDAVRPGMFARVRIPTETRTGILVVPNTAVVTETGVDYILQVVDGTVKKTAVQTGISDDTVTEIRAGLTDGAVVITEGQSFLTDGEKVTPAG